MKLSAIVGLIPQSTQVVLGPNPYRHLFSARIRSQSLKFRLIDYHCLLNQSQNNYLELVLEYYSVISSKAIHWDHSQSNFTGTGPRTTLVLWGINPTRVLYNLGY